MELSAQKLWWKKWKNTISVVASIVVMITFISGALWLKYNSMGVREIQIQELLERERMVTCPALLSIARTPRDTLIVMKNKPVCVEYVFENM